MRGRLSVGAALLLLALLGAAPAARAESGGWHSEQPPAASGLQVPLGEVGDIEFWAPNRGALITAGVGGMPAGVYVYDGVGWHLYSTVCGGHRGRIAWVGPDDFWTVADQPVGQEGVVGEAQTEAQWDRSLCHFRGGSVVASYARPLGQPDSFPHILAAACEPAIAQCWFGGERLAGNVNVGAFHLFWNGSGLTEVPSLGTPEAGLEDPGRTVADLAFDGGLLYESVKVAKADGAVAGEPNSAQPSYIHLVQIGTPHPFTQLFPATPLSYGGTAGVELGPFRFADAGEGLFALAGAAEGTHATVTMVSIRGAEMTQVPLAANTVFHPGDKVEDAAAEPGTGRIWVAYRQLGNQGPEPLPTRLVSVGENGTVGPPLELFTPSGARQGTAGPIACPAAEQCWVATASGWLYHLGGPLPRDEDPALVGPITFRPADESTPSLPPAELPQDDSGAEAAKAEVPVEIIEPLPHHGKPKRLISKVAQRMIGRTTLQLSFTLFARAHVRLRAERHGKVVASTPRLTLGSGRHRLRLRLDPKHWPTHLDFEVHPAGGKK